MVIRDIRKILISGYDQTQDREIIKASKDFGFGGLKLKAEDFMSPENIVQLGYEPYPIDILVDVEGVDFEECFERRIEAEREGAEVKFLSIQDLITAKKYRKTLRFG